MVKVSMDNWQAESDADLMARYEELMADSTRLSKAIKAAKNRAKDLEESAERMKKVANFKKGKK